MVVPPSCYVIGFTGSFGSGCTTAAEVLSDRNLKLLGTTRVRRVRLSDEVRDEWRAAHPKQPPTRAALQATGDCIRQRYGYGELARRAITRTQTLRSVFDFVFVDGIRNTGEIHWLRRQFADHFYLIAVDAPTELRWLRSQAVYHKNGLTEADFHGDDTRDLGEETPHGQQVQLCVDQADLPP